MALDLKDVIVGGNLDVNEGKKKPAQNQEGAPAQEIAPTLASSGDVSSILEDVNAPITAKTGTVGSTISEEAVVDQVEDAESEINLESVVVPEPSKEEKVSIMKEFEQKDLAFNRDIQARQEARMSDLVSNSSKIKIFNETFMEANKGEFENLLSKLEKKYPNWRTDAEQAEAREKEYSAFANDLYARKFEESDLVKSELKNIQSQIGEEFQGEIDAYFGDRKKFFSQFEEGVFGDSWLYQAGQHLIENDYFGITETAGGVLKNIGINLEHTGFVGNNDTDQEFLEIYNKGIENMKRKFEAGEIDQATYDRHVKRYEKKIEEREAIQTNRLYTEDFISRVQQSGYEGTEDKNDPFYDSWLNDVLLTSKQAVNMMPGMIAEGVKSIASRAGAPGKILGLAADMTATALYANQLSREMGRTVYGALAAKQFGVPESEVTNEMISAAMASPEGMALKDDIHWATVAGGAWNKAQDWLLLKGGGAAKKFGMKLLNRNKGKILKIGQKIFNNKLGNIAIGVGGVKFGVESEKFEESGQQLLGDLVKYTKVTNPEAGIGDIANFALNQYFSDDYKHLREITGKSSWLLSGGSFALGEIGNSASQMKANLSKANNLVKMSNMSKEKFNDFITGAKEDMSKVYNDPQSTQEQKDQARDFLYQALDTEEAYNSLQTFPSIQGKARGTAMSLLTERAQLQRQVNMAANNGLVVNQKERIKAIDEQLAKIEGRSKKGYKSSTLEKIRNLVGPKRSVGAMRAASEPQKIIDSIEDMAVGVVDSAQLYRRASKLGVDDQVIQEVYNVYSSEEYQKSGANSVFEFLQGQESKQQAYESGQEYTETTTETPKPSFVDVNSTETIGEQEQQKIEKFYHDQGLAVDDKLAARFENPYVQPTDVGRIQAGLDTSQSVDELVGKMINFEQNAAEMRRLAAFNASVSENMSNRSNAAQDVRNQNWVPNRINKQTKNAEAALKRVLQGKSGPKEYSAQTVEALQEFIGIKNMINELVANYVNENYTQKGRDATRQSVGAWDTIIDDINLIAERVSKGGVDKETQKKFQTQLSHKVGQLKGMYAIGLEAVERKIAEQGAKEGKYPPYFDPSTGKFQLVFENKFGNSVAYEQLGPNGKAIFDNMKISDWATYVNKLAKYQETQKPAALKALKNEANRIQKIGLNEDEKKAFDENDKKEQEAKERAVKLLEQGEVTSRAVMVKDDTAVADINRANQQESRSKEYHQDTIAERKGDKSKYITKSKDKLKEVHKDNAIMKWDALAAADKKSALEGDLAHMILVQGAAQRLTDRQSNIVNTSELNDLFDTPYSVAWQTEEAQKIMAEMEAIETVNEGWQYIDELYTRHSNLGEQLRAIEQGVYDNLNTEDTIGGRFEKKLKEYIELVGEEQAIALLNRVRTLNFKTDLITKAQAGNEVVIQALINQHEGIVNLIASEFVPEFTSHGNTAGGKVLSPDGTSFTPKVGQSSYTDWDNVFVGGPTTSDYVGVGRQALRKAILYYDPSKGKLSTYLTNVVRGAIVTAQKGQGINWAPVKKTVEARNAAQKLELLKQLWVEDVFGTNVDQNLIGEDDGQAKVLSKEQTHFAHNLVHDNKSRNIANTKQAISQTQALINASSNPVVQARMEQKKKLLIERLNDIENDTDVSNKLIPSTRDNVARNSGFTPGTNEYNLTIAAGAVIEGQELGNEVLGLIDTTGVPANLTEQEYKAQAAVYEVATKSTQEIQERLDMAANDAKSIALAKDTNLGLTESERLALDQVQTQQKALKKQLKTSRNAQLNAAKTIIAVEAGKTTIDGKQYGQKQIKGGDVQSNDPKAKIQNKERQEKVDSHLDNPYIHGGLGNYLDDIFGDEWIDAWMSFENFDNGIFDQEHEGYSSEEMKALYLSIWQHGAAQQSPEVKNELLSRLKALSDVVLPIQSENDFNELIDSIKNPDGTLSIARVVEMEDGPADKNVGTSWSVDDRLIKNWSAGRDHYIFYADINIDDKSSFLPTRDDMHGNEVTLEVIALNEEFKGKNFKWDRVVDGEIVESGSFDDTLKTPKETPANVELNKEGNSKLIIKDGNLIPISESANLQALADELAVVSEGSPVVNEVIRSTESKISDIHEQLAMLEEEQLQALQEADNEIQEYEGWTDDEYGIDERVHDMSDFHAEDYYGDLSEGELEYHGYGDQYANDVEGDRPINPWLGTTDETKQKIDRLHAAAEELGRLEDEIDRANQALLALQNAGQLSESTDSMEKQLLLDTIDRVNKRLDSVSNLAEDGKITLLTAGLKKTYSNVDTFYSENRSGDNLALIENKSIEQQMDNMLMQQASEANVAPKVIESNKMMLNGKEVTVDTYSDGKRVVRDFKKKPPMLLFMNFKKPGFTMDQLNESSAKFEAWDAEVDTRVDSTSKIKELKNKNKKDIHDRSPVEYLGPKEGTYKKGETYGFYTRGGIPKGIQTFVEYEQNFDEYIDQGYSYEDMALLFFEHLAKRPESSKRTVDYMVEHYDNVIKIFEERNKMDDFRKALGAHSEVLLQVVKESKGPIPIFRGEPDLYSTNKALVHGTLSSSIAYHHANRERKNAKGEIIPNNNPTVKVFMVDPKDIDFVMNTRAINGIGEMEVFFKGETLSQNPQVFKANEFQTLNSKLGENKDKPENCT